MKVPWSALIATLWLAPGLAAGERGPDAPPTDTSTAILSEAPPDAPSDDLEAILAIAGDTAYGRFLSGACAACHRAGADRDGIPAIHGQPAEALVIALYDYRSGLRPNETMQMIARGLSDQEIAALAAFYAAAEQGGDRGGKP